MSKLIFGTLYSGSSGNAVYISCGSDTILIDAGKSARCAERTMASIGGNMQNVRAIFVTHEHSDHVSALPVLSKKYEMPIYMPLACAETFSELPSGVLPYEGSFCQDVGPFHVESFSTPHDSAASMGYIVTVEGKKLGIATDMGMLAKSVVSKLTGCHAALIECNYDSKMLASGSYPPYLKERVGSARGHLSNSDGALLAAILAFSGTEHILLGHLSKENNTPDKALSAVKAELKSRKVQARVLVAGRDCPTILLEEELSC